MCSSHKHCFKIGVVFLFIIYPLFSLPFLIIGILNKEKWAYILASIFLGYMGILYPPAGDMYRYAQDFNFYKELDWDYFWIFMALKFDYFLPLLSFSFGKLGLYAESTRFIFVACSYYMLFDLYHDITSYNKELSKVRILVLFMLVPLTFSSYLFRMGFAQTTLIYGIYWFLIREQRRGILFIILAALIHWSYTPFLFIVLISKSKFFNFSIQTFTVLVCLLIFVQSSSLGSFIIRILPLPELLLNHVEEYISGSESGVIQFSLKQLIVSQFFNLVYYFTLWQYYTYYKDNPQPLRIKQFVNLFMIMIIVSSSIPVLHGRMLGVLKSLLVLSFIFYYKNLYHRFFKFICFLSVIGVLFSFWQLRFYIRFGQYDQLFKSSSIGLIAFHYTDDWVDRNIDDDGNLIKWLNLGYRPAEKE